MRLPEPPCLAALSSRLQNTCRIPVDEGELLLAVVVVELDALPAEELPVGVHRVLQLRLDVHGLHRQGEAAVLDAGELQQLLHHVGQPPGLGHDDAHALLHVPGVPHLPVHDGLRPAVDGGEGGAQLVGDGGDELVLHLLALVDTQGHVVDGVGQGADLVVVPLLDLHAVGALGDALGGLGNPRHRIHDGADEVQVGEVHDAQDRQADAQGDGHDDDDLPVYVAQGGDVAHGPHHLAVDHQGAGGRHDVLAGAGVGAHPGAGLLLADGLGDLRRAGDAEGGEIRAGKADAPAAVQILHLQVVAVGIPCHHRPGIAVVVVPAAVVKAADGVLRLLAQGLAHGGVVIAPHGRGEGCHRQQDDKQHHADGVHHPPLSDTSDFFHAFPSPPGSGSCLPECARLGCRGRDAPRGPACGGRMPPLRSPTYIRSPTPW